MKLARIELDGRPVIAVETPEGLAPTTFTSIDEVVTAGIDRVHPADARRLPLETATLLAPLLPGKVICAGVNYESHLAENPKASRPARPFFFAKLTSSVIGPGEAIVKPEPATQLDPEVELGVVIGRRARNLDRLTALEHVFGYTILNDVSAREWQFAPDAQMMLGKGMDTMCPIGPVIVTADALDPAALRLSCRVDGERRQDSTTEESFFDVATLLVELTRYVTLEPGDIVSTGTPAGVGLFRDPPVWLEPGQVVELEIEGIGRLANPVVAGWVRS